MWRSDSEFWTYRRVAFDCTGSSRYLQWRQFQRDCGAASGAVSWRHASASRCSWVDASLPALTVEPALEENKIERRTVHVKSDQRPPLDTFHRSHDGRARRQVKRGRGGEME